MINQTIWKRIEKCSKERVCGMVNAPKSTPYRIENIFINHQTRFQGHTRESLLLALMEVGLYSALFTTTIRNLNSLMEK